MATGAGHGTGRKQGDKKRELVQDNCALSAPTPTTSLPTSAHHRSLGFPSVSSSLPLPS